MNQNVLNERAQRFRTCIHEYIDARRDTKLKGKEDPETAAKYEYAVWLASAAKRAGQIQVVTHVAKTTHPDAKGSSFWVDPQNLPAHKEVGTHVLPQAQMDVVGNAAALDVFGLLAEEVDGYTLLEWCGLEDADLCAALDTDEATAKSWMESFAAIRSSETKPSAHGLVKQVYWLTGNDAADNSNFHLLEPLFSSSLEHVIYNDVREVRFSQTNKQARAAYREGKPHDAPFYAYPKVVTRQLGGTKPQNISKLNSDRHGENNLLASLPPVWRLSNTRKLHSGNTLWKAFIWFGGRDGVSNQVQELAEFLNSEPPNTMPTRRRREGMEQALGAQLVAFSEAVQSAREPGWTRDIDCQLPQALKIWLDPERLNCPPGADEETQQDDEAFERDYHWGDWPDGVAGAFAHWLNATLRDRGVPTLGDVTYKHWAKQAIVEAAWPVPMQRRAPEHTTEEVSA